LNIATQKAKAAVLPMLSGSGFVARQGVSAKVQQIPQNDVELKSFLLNTFGVVLPDTKVCPEHSTPFRAFADAYFARSSVAVWKASRGFGGKSYLLSLLGAVEAATLHADVTILGGSGEQSSRVHEYVSGWFLKLGFEDSTKRETLLPTGGRVRALMASTRSVRGPHPQRLRIDEADEVEIGIIDAAMGQPMSKSGIPKQTVFSSTHQYPDAAMSELLRRAGENAWPVHSWCYRETSAKDGWLSQEEIVSKRAEVTAAMFAAEYDLQEPSPEDRAILPEKVSLCFKRELGEDDGKLGRPCVIEEPVEGAKYAHGADWAKKKDFTVIDTWRIDVRPFRRVAWVRLGRMPWPEMIAKFNDRVKKYGGQACHDATGIGDVVGDYQTVNAEGVVLTGQTRADVFTTYIAAIENGDIESPLIRYCEAEHRYATNDDLRGAGHPPDSFVAGAMAHKAATLPPPKRLMYA
jgi:hypothetical protein